MSVVEQRSTEGAQNVDSPRVRHFLHPTDPAKRWCGAKASGGRKFVKSLDEIGCVVCVDLFNTYGMDGWLRGEGPA